MSENFSKLIKIIKIIYHMCIVPVSCLLIQDSISREVYAVTLAFFSKMTNLAVPDIFVPKMHIVEG